MIETLPTGSAKIIGYRLSGRLHDEDYRSFVPAVDAAVRAEGKVRFFLQFEDFHGWDLHAAWDDLCLGLKHYRDFDRIAMVGGRRWERWPATIWKPFTTAKVMYFDVSEVEAAWKWIGEG